MLLASAIIGDHQLISFEINDKQTTWGIIKLVNEIGQTKVKLIAFYSQFLQKNHMSRARDLRHDPYLDLQP